MIAAVVATALRTPEAIQADPPAGRHARFLDRLGLHALDAGLEALAAAKLSAASDRIGLFVGTSGLRPRWDEMRAALSGPSAAGPWEAGLRKLHPFWMLQHLSNNMHALLSMEAGIRGEGATFGGAVSGAEALQAATRALHANAVDAALVVAYDEAVAAMVLARPGELTRELGHIEVSSGVDGNPQPSADEIENSGAATSVVQAVSWLRRTAAPGSAVLLSNATQGFVSVVRVEVF